MKPNIVILASGSGSNFQAIIDAIANGDLDARICRLIASRDGIGAVQKANYANIPVSIINRKTFISPDEYNVTLLNTLKNENPDLIVLAGFLQKIPETVITEFQNRILNIHPSLLPKYGGKGFFGLNVHRAVLENKEAISGCTVHIVNEEFDEGPILAQTTVEVFENDTVESLASRVLAAEHKLYPLTIKQFLANRNP